MTRPRDLSTDTGAATRAETAAWLWAVTEGRLSRRDFLVRAAALGLSASAVGSLLAACGGSSGGSTGARPSTLDKTLPQAITLYNWGFYMNPKVKKDFKSKTGVAVVEKTFASQDAMYAGVKKGEVFDAVMGSDVWVTVMSKAGLVQPLHLDLLLNLANVTDPTLRAPAFDDPAKQGGRKYSVPYMFGTTGFAARLDEIPDPGSSWAILYDKKYGGRICMLDGSREVLGPALFLTGSSLNTTDQAALDTATAKAIAQKPLVVKYDSITQAKSISSGVPLVECWDGDAIGVMNKIGISKIRYVLPNEGYQIWEDGICVPANAPSPYAAHLFLDYLLEPAVAAANANYIGYQPAVAAADPLIKSLVQRAERPTPDVLARGTMSVDLGSFNAAFDKAWAQIQAAPA